MSNLVLDQPDDPISYLVSLLKNPPKNLVFLVSPPHLRLPLKNLADEINYNYLRSGDVVREYFEAKNETVGKNYINGKLNLNSNRNLN